MKGMRETYILAIAVLFLASCGPNQEAQEAKKVLHEPPAAPPPPPEPPGAEVSKKAIDAAMAAGFGGCEDIKQIRTVPLKGELGIDPAYDRVMVNFSSYQPCLIATILDEEPLRDPSESPARSPFFLGDLAYDLIIDSRRLDYQTCMPNEVKVSYQQIGYFAFHKWLHENGNRKKLHLCVEKNLIENKDE